MFLRRSERKKNGKVHSYWSIVENRRLDGGRVVQRHVLYLGEINSSQAEAWRGRSRCSTRTRARPVRCRCFPKTIAICPPPTLRSCGCVSARCAFVVRASG